MRGSSPGSRELSSLDLERRATEVHGILLSGGSAFGLSAADGVMRWLEEHGTGYRTEIAVIPIVPAAVIFDGAATAGPLRPQPSWGYEACQAAVAASGPNGRVGAGAGATVGKWAGRDYRVPGGFGVASASIENLRVVCLAVVNALGDVLDGDGRVLAGTSAPEPRFRRPPVPPPPGVNVPANTVLGVVMTTATIDKAQAHYLAARGSDGMTRSIRPAHTRYDGDVVFAVAGPSSTVQEAGDLDLLGVLAADTMATAIRDAVR